MIYNQEDTIVAISTALVESAISIIRISGKKAISIANQIFSKDLFKIKSHTVTFGYICSKKEKIDSCLLIVMKSPKSFTKEDIVEIHCHGGILITKKILQKILDKGARLASPGEFSYRAFMNKKMDLLQAEAIQKLISAKNEKALQIAKNQKDGLLSKKIKYFQKEIFDIASEIEVFLDFSEEDLEFMGISKIKNKLQKIIKDLENLKNTFNEGKFLFDSPTLAILGDVNVGKSTLMNLFCKSEKAIVTKIAGTTRDILEELVVLKNTTFKILDTAGMRKSKNEIEKIGIEKSKKILKTADFKIFLLDNTKKISLENQKLLKSLDPKNTIVAINKIDLEKKIGKVLFPNKIKISAKKEINIDLLKEQIEKMVFSKKNFSNDVVITSQRHKEILEKTILSLKKALSNLKEKKILFELVAFDIKEGLNTLNDIIRCNVTENILSSIFSKFCIGK